MIDCAVARYMRRVSVLFEYRVVGLKDTKCVLNDAGVLFIEKFQFTLSLTKTAHEETELFPYVSQVIVQVVNVDINVGHWVAEFHVQNLDHSSVTECVDGVEDGQGRISHLYSSYIADNIPGSCGNS